MRNGGFMVILGAALFALAGAAMIFGAFWFTRGSSKFLVNAVHVNGRILELKEETDKNGTNKTTSFYPVIEFKAEDGVSYKFKSALAVDPDENPAGEDIKVIYSRNNPAEAKIDSINSIWGGSIYLLIFGIIFIAAAMFIYFALYRNAGINTKVFVSWGFFTAAILLFALAYFISKESIYLKAHGIKTAGVIVDFNPSPVIEYKAENGKVYRHRPEVSDSNSKLAQGDKVFIIYDPERPARSKIDSFDDLWFAASLTGGFGFLCLAAFIGILIFFRK